MCRRTFIILAIGILLVVASGSALAHEATWGLTQVLQYNSEIAYDGYTLFDYGITTYLIDMKGKKVITREWESGGTTELLENGHFLRHQPAEGGSVPDLRWGGESGQVSEYDWDGNLIWRYFINSEDEISHHWLHRKPNGNTLVMVWERIPYDVAVAHGRDPATLSNSDCYNSVAPPGRYKCDLWPDKIVELGPDGTPTGWEWRAWEHMVQDFDPSKLNWYGPTGVSDHPELIDINYRFPISKDSHRASADFMHANRVDFQADSAGSEEGRIVLNSRVFGEFYVIHYPSGNIIDRWGNPCAYKQGECPSYMNDGDQQLFGAHASHFIKPGFPGEGNILVWDNGWMRPTGGNSRVVEVDLTTGAIVWQYTTASSMYSAFVGDVRRLANGNTLMSSSLQGHFLEVTPDGDFAWEYVVPLYGDEALCAATDNDQFANFTGVVRRYGPDFPAFSGKYLWREGPIKQCWPCATDILDYLSGQ